MPTTWRPFVLPLASCLLLASIPLQAAPLVDWKATVDQTIAAEEYELSRQSEPLSESLTPGWQAPNRAHAFRTYFDPDGIRVVPRAPGDTTWEWRLELSGYGRAGHVGAVPGADLVADRNRIRYERGSIVEWYVNSPQGLEQGFTLYEPPAGETGSGQLVLELALRGTLSPRIRDAGQTIDFISSDGVAVIRYSKLLVTDATGHPLAAHMEGTSRPGRCGIRIVIEDAGALYPLTVDPLATTAAWFVESDQDSARLGNSVAAAGDVNGDGHGDVLVGAVLFDGGESDEGKVWLYLGSPGGLSATAAWTAEGDQDGARFGISVSTAGDINGDGYSDVIIGADQYDNGETDEGAAFVYVGSATGLSVAPYRIIDIDQAEAGLGRSVSTAGDVNGDGFSDVIVGARFYDNGQNNEGQALVFHGSATGLSATPDWAVESNQADGNFGFSVSTAGDVDGDGYADVIVGAPAHDNGLTNEGQARVYLGSASGLSTTLVWVSEGNQTDAEHGWSVATAGDVNGDGYADVIVGSRGWDTASFPDAGRALIYHGSPTGPSAVADWIYDGANQNLAYAGNSVATAGDVDDDGYADVLVGAPLFDNTLNDEGSAMLFRGSPSGASAVPDWERYGEDTSAEFGFSVATAGDVDGDGRSDVLVGARRNTQPETEEGRAYLYSGQGEGLSMTEAWMVAGTRCDNRFGVVTGTAGDVNGDGYADVFVAEFDYTGDVYVYHGSPSGPATTLNWQVSGPSDFGNHVSTAGDVNGDGYDDLIVGQEESLSEAYVYHGSPTGLATTADWSASNVGGVVSTAGDVNGDGYADVLIGDPTVLSNDGSARLYFGSASGLSSFVGWVFELAGLGAQVGATVTGAGDLNGDGYADIAIAAPAYDVAGVSDNGAVFVFHGSSAGPSLVPDWTIIASAGQSVGAAARAGDVNGDGFSDLVVRVEGLWVLYPGSASGLSTANWTTPEVASANAGLAGDINGDGFSDLFFRVNQSIADYSFNVFFGSVSGPSLTPDWTVVDTVEFPGILSLWSQGVVGDVDGNGYADVIIGSSRFDCFGFGEARIHLSEENGVSRTPQQRRADDTAPVAHEGAVSGTAFRLAAMARTAFGPGRVKLEWEVKPFGTAFDGTGTVLSASWIDTGMSGAALNELVSGLAGGTSYHWRARVRYDPVTTPYLAASGWLAVPWNGGEEFDFRSLASGLPVADVSVTQTDDVDPNVDGNDIVYTLTVSNAGPAAVVLFLNDTLPAGTTFVSAVPTQGTCSHSSGLVSCPLGTVAAGGSVEVVVQITPPGVGVYINTAEVTGTFDDPDPSDNLSTEDTTIVLPAIGDRVWEDLDGDGVQDPGEPGVVGALVALYWDGYLDDFTFTDANGNYSFTVEPGTYFVRFFPPTGYVLSPQNQGGDDGADSDADPLTGDTPTIVPTLALDMTRWDAGVVPTVACVPPDEPIWVYDMTLSTDGNDYPIAHFMDANQPDQVTGYNIYRSSDAGLDPALWPLVASDVIDMDEATPNKQWVDISGDVSPTGIWYYDVAAYNNRCPAEGPR